MHDMRTVRRAIELNDSGLSIRDVARQLGIAPKTVWSWCRDPERAVRARTPDPCFACGGGVSPAPDRYGYLLGQYLGDGHLVTAARVPVLRIYACTDYPAIVEEIVDSIERVRRAAPGRVNHRCSERLVTVQSYWNHWPCLFPQSGPGRKHTRPIVLEPWQRDIVDEHPWPLIRGLIHSDGCRAINRVVVRGKAYEYPRYFFANESADILGIMGAALDRVGVAWRFNRRNSISIARRGAVAIMDEHIGPKR